MKRIIEVSSQGFHRSINPYEIVKIRLRGKGSGFKEGPNELESEEPLNICVTSRFKENYQHACMEMEKLLLEVYEEFKGFGLNDSGNSTQTPFNPPHYQELKMKKIETIGRPDDIGDQ